MIKTGGFDAVCFTSSSTVRNLVGIAGKPHARTIVACTGPKTAETATEFGLRVDVQPETASIPDLVDALAKLQNDDGSFKTTKDRWMENNPVLITAYSLLALQHAARE